MGKVYGKSYIGALMNCAFNHRNAAAADVVSSHADLHNMHCVRLSEPDCTVIYRHDQILDVVRQKPTTSVYHSHRTRFSLLFAHVRI